MSLRVLTIGNMYPPHSLGGYEVTWHAAVAGLRRAGHEVRVLTTDFELAGADEAAEPGVHRELRWYWREHEFPRLSLRERLGIERHNGGVLHRHLGEFRPHVVDWWAMGGMSLGLIEAVARRGLPAVGVVADDWMVYGPEVDGWQRAAGRLGWLRAPLERLAGVPARVDLGAAADWLFISEATRAGTTASGQELPRSEVAHWGVDPELLAPASERPWEGRLLFCGRLDARKGAHVAIDALRHLPAVTLRIVGGGDPAYLGELRARVERERVAERVSFASVDHGRIRAVYAGADALVFPSLWEEPWGLVPLEAMSVGAPVIATGSGGSAEYLRDGENCLLYGPGEDSRALADAVERLAGDAALRRRLRSAGFETAGRYRRVAFEAAHREALERAVAAGHDGGTPTRAAPRSPRGDRPTPR